MVALPHVEWDTRNRDVSRARLWKYVSEPLKPFSFLMTDCSCRLEISSFLRIKCRANQLSIVGRRWASVHFCLPHRDWIPQEICLSRVTTALLRTLNYEKALPLKSVRWKDHAKGKQGSKALAHQHLVRRELRLVSHRFLLKPMAKLFEWLWRGGTAVGHLVASLWKWVPCKEWDTS